jgi:hypothetical protein
LTSILNALSKFWIVDWPENTKFLTTEEKALFARKLTDDGGAARMDYFNRKSVKIILLDWMS